MLELKLAAHGDADKQGAGQVCAGVVGDAPLQKVAQRGLAERLSGGVQQRLAHVSVLALGGQVCDLQRAHKARVDRLVAHIAHDRVGGDGVEDGQPLAAIDQFRGGLDDQRIQRAHSELVPQVGVERAVGVEKGVAGRAADGCLDHRRVSEDAQPPAALQVSRQALHFLRGEIVPGTDDEHGAGIGRHLAHFRQGQRLDGDALPVQADE